MLDVLARFVAGQDMFYLTLNESEVFLVKKATSPLKGMTTEKSS